jgi:hypothetical protein
MISSNYDATDRGMLNISMDDKVMVQIEHQVMDDTVEFHRDYFDEVVDTLNEVSTMACVGDHGRRVVGSRHDI